MNETEKERKMKYGENVGKKRGRKSKRKKTNWNENIEKMSGKVRVGMKTKREKEGER